MKSRIKIPLYILTISVLAGIVYATNFTGRPPLAEAGRVTAPEPVVGGVVAGVHTSKGTAPAENKVISPSGRPPAASNEVTLQVYDVTGRTPSASAGNGGQPPSSPSAPTPETITVNLKTPHTYTLKPGERSPVLKHEMTDGKQYEWLPSYATAWQDEPRDLTLPVWSYIQLPKPDGPYVGHELPFVIEAASNAPAGTFKVKVGIVLRTGIVAHVPVTVTVEP